MPETPNIPPTGAELQRRALHMRYRIQVIPQPARADFGNGLVDTEGAWQWNVAVGRGGAAVATGNSCRTPHEAFDQALAAMRNLLPDPAPEPLAAPEPGATYAQGGYTGRNDYSMVTIDAGSYASAQSLIRPYTLVDDSTSRGAVSPTVGRIASNARMYLDGLRGEF